MSETSIQMEGMSCASCVDSVEKAIYAAEGIDKDHSEQHQTGMDV